MQHPNLNITNPHQLPQEPKYSFPLTALPHSFRPNIIAFQRNTSPPTAYSIFASFEEWLEAEEVIWRLSRRRQCCEGWWRGNEAQGLEEKKKEKAFVGVVYWVYEFS
jgi:hypothetical protein